MPTTSNRLRAKTGVIFNMKIGAASNVDFGADIKKISVKADDADDSGLTFAEVASGLTKVYTVTLTAIVSNDSGSLYEYLWTNPGATFVVDYAPQGNAAATATKPHYGFTAQATGKPVFDLEANLDANYGAEFEYDLNVVGDITKAVS